MSTTLGALGSLADAQSHHARLSDATRDVTAHVDSLRKMILIRAVEEKIADMVTTGVIKCPCHLAIGQEAPAVGVAKHIRQGDRLFGAHRSHAHYLALGGSVHGLLAEVLGKNTGVSRGMGGSMHLMDRANGLYGTVPIVGATIPIAVGAGIAAKMDGNSNIAVAFFGDGATEEGGFHESMNLAAVLKAPVLFVCENNLFSSHLHIDLRQPSNSTARYAEAHGVPHATIDGNDILAIDRAVADAMHILRDGQGPYFLELVTYRWRGHVGPSEDEDVGVRRKDDLALWKLRDPVRRLAELLVTEGLILDSGVAEMTSDACAITNTAWELAVSDPYPPAEALFTTVWAEKSRI